MVARNRQEEGTPIIWDSCDKTNKDMIFDFDTKTEQVSSLCLAPSLERSSTTCVLIYVEVPLSLRFAITMAFVWKQVQTKQVWLHICRRVNLLRMDMLST